MQESSVSARLLQECRDLASERFAKKLPELMDNVDDALFELADKGGNVSEEALYFDAMREVRLRRATIEAGFRAVMTQTVDGMIARVSAGARHELDAKDSESFFLLGDAELEEDLAVTNIATKIRGMCKAPLFLLDRRMGVLLGAPELSGEENPLGPEVVCRAFTKAYGCIEAGIEVRLLLLKLFEQFVVHEFEPLYAAINEHLVESGVLANLKPGVGARSNAAAGAAPTDARLSQGLSGEVDCITAVSKPARLSEEGLIQSAGSRVPGEVERNEALPAAAALWHVLESWSRAGPGENFPLTPKSQAITTLTELQHSSLAAKGPGTTGLHHGEFDLRSLKDRGISDLSGACPGGPSSGLGIGPDNEILIDIVAMMFDYILDEQQLAAPIRGLIARLQIPVLKVALLDRTLFSRRDHPARKFLNTLANSGSGWVEGGGNEALYVTMERLVYRILDEFDEDISIFEDVLKELEVFLAQATQARERQAEAQIRAMERRERLDEAKATVKRELRDALDGASLPPIVRRFLTRYLGGNLVVIYVKRGPSSQVWQEAIGTMRRLVWSLAPKETRQARSQLLRELPVLLQQVNHAIEKASVPPGERDELVTTLAKRHAELVRAEPNDGEPPDVNTDTDLTGGEVQHAVTAGEGFDARIQPPDGPVSHDLPAGNAVGMPSGTAPGLVGSPLLYPEQALLNQSIARANRQIFDRQSSDPSMEGMGTTLVAAVFCDDRVHYAHVGDSRLYRFRANVLEQLTCDHSLAQELIDKGYYTPEEAAERVNRNIVTRGLGVEPSVLPDLAWADCEVGDLYLACSDGLTDMVEARQLEAIVGRYHAEPDALVERLVRRANQHGGHDNISVLIARVEKPFPCVKRWRLAKSLRGRIRFAGVSDTGRQRAHNEDSIAVAAELGAMVVADGMGGLKAGEVASTMAVHTLMDDLGEGLPTLWKASLGDGASGAVAVDDTQNVSGGSGDSIRKRMLRLLARTDEPDPSEVESGATPATLAPNVSSTPELAGFLRSGKAPILQTAEHDDRAENPFMEQSGGGAA